MNDDQQGESRSTLIQVKLPHGVWSYDTQRRLGKAGGFASVFEGSASDGSPVAIKRFRFDKRHLSHREIEIAVELHSPDLRHVMRVLDAGIDADSDEICIVMPRAERTLKDDLREKGRLSEQEAVAILLEILAGLDEVPHLVHRDLKPANILFHQSVWKVADFGIARFSEMSTSENTLANAYSRPYAAPEQWLEKEVSRETDLYALGCIGYELVARHPPFRGPDPAAYRK